jgi:hypothetical protein
MYFDSEIYSRFYEIRRLRFSSEERGNEHRGHASDDGGGSLKRNKTIRSYLDKSGDGFEKGGIHEVFFCAPAVLDGSSNGITEDGVCASYNSLRVFEGVFSFSSVANFTMAVAHTSVALPMCDSTL